MADWKYFLIEVTYLIPAEQMAEITVEHRAWLQTGYDQSWLLISGPQVPRTGGIIIGRAPSREAIEAFFANDPYQVKQIAAYRFVEFTPIKRQAFLDDWLA